MARSAKPRRRLLLPMMMAAAWLAAVAAPACPALAQPFCDSYGETLSAVEIADLHEQLIMLAPVRHSALARSIRIVNDPGTEEQGPAAVPASGGRPPTILVPRGFRRLQCRLVQIRTYSIIGVLPPDAPLAQAMRGCGDPAIARLPRGPQWEAAARRELQRCLVRVASETVVPIETRQPFSPGSRADMRRIIDEAFLDTILHEFAHLALRHVFEYRRREPEADAYALLRAFALTEPSPAAFSTYATLAMADYYVSPTSYHGKYACRALIANDVATALQAIAGDAFFWVANDPALYLTRRQGSRNARIRRLPIYGDTAGCPRVDMSRVAVIETDLRTLVARLDELARGEASPGALLDGIEAIMAVPIATEEARTLRYTLLSVRLRHIMREHSDPAIRARELVIVRQILDQRDTAMSSEDFGRLSAVAAILAYEGMPHGSSLIAANEALRRALTDARRHHPRFGLVYLWLGRIAYMGGRCPEGRGHFQRMRELAGDASGEPPDVGRMLAEEAARGCARAGETIREERRRRYQWR